MTQRKGNAIETFSGIAFYPLDPRTEEIKIKDIAHALSNVCRFGGHCKYFYSVAQHSLNVCIYLSQQYSNNYKILLYGLLHDATVGYIVDVPRPIKESLEKYKTIENRIQNTIFQALNLPLPTKEEKNIIKEVKEQVYKYESLNLMPCKVQFQDEKLSLDCDISYNDPKNIEKDFIETLNLLLDLHKKNS